MTSNIRIIAAVSNNGVIGVNGKLPWRQKADMERFRRVTHGSPVLMGRKTYESIGHPLEGRRNIVLTRDRCYPYEGCDVVHNINSALRIMADGHLWVIGGSQLYAQLIPIACMLYITRIDAHIKGDALFPYLDPRDWKLMGCERFPADTGNQYPYCFETWER